MVDLEERVRAIAREEVAAALDGFDPVPREWFTSPQAAEYLGVSRGTVHNLVSSGRLARRGDRGHRLVFARADLDAFMAGGAS